MADTGWIAGEILTQPNGFGGPAAWFSLGNIESEDGNVATCTITAAQDFSTIAVMSGFNIGPSTIPDGSTILGIEVRAKLRNPTGGAFTTISTVAAFKATLTGWTAAAANTAIASNVALTWHEPMSAPSLFGQSWTPAEIRDAGFGVGIGCAFSGSNGSGSVDLDAVQARVTFSLPTLGGFFFSMLPWLAPAAALGGLTPGLLRQRARALALSRPTALAV